MYCVTLVVDNYLSYHFVYWLMNTHIFRRRQQFPLSICDFMVKLLYPLRSLSVVRFQIWKFPTGSEAISVSIFSLKKGWVGVTAGQALSVLMEYFVFHKIFLSLITSWLYDPSRCLTAWNNYQLTGTGISLPQDLTRSLERTRPPTWAFLRLQTLPRTETWHRRRPSQRVRRDP